MVQGPSDGARGHRGWGEALTFGRRTASVRRSARSSQRVHELAPTLCDLLPLPGLRFRYPRCRSSETRRRLGRRGETLTLRLVRTVGIVIALGRVHARRGCLRPFPSLSHTGCSRARIPVEGCRRGSRARSTSRGGSGGAAPVSAASARMPCGVRSTVGSTGLVEPGTGVAHPSQGSWTRRLSRRPWPHGLHPASSRRQVHPRRGCSDHRTADGRRSWRECSHGVAGMAGLRPRTGDEGVAIRTTRR